MLCCIITVLLGVLVDVSSGMMRIQLIPQYPVIGGSLTLSVTGITDGILSFSWYKGPTSSSQLQIFTYIPGDRSPLVRGPSYNFRIIAFPNGSLQISDLQTTDRGNYIVKVQTQKALESTLDLVIYDPVSKPVITVSEPQEDGTITLTCASSNTERTIWSKGGDPLPSGAVLSSNNKTVTFSGTNRLDSGDYQCTAENIASTKTSDSYTLAIAYGPENANIKGSSQVTIGSVMSLVCVAESFPTPIYSWQLNGRNLTLHHNNTLLIEQITSMNEGNYTCEVKNLATKLSASASMFITVTESGLRTETVAGIISGTVLAFVLVIIVVVMIYKIFPFPAKKEETKQEKDQTCKEIPEEEIYVNGDFYEQDNVYEI